MLLPNCKSSMAAPRRASATSTTAEGRHATLELQSSMAAPRRASAT
ncbi:hypothetical protein LF1_01870 [Rubripirellula obstinata]|uniref:Uncharacterized protein n=1 Tax=Rubripirellula obstinata TaxID=406547 RepID=A0A5B1CD85_9BACT|nr:hypothetical protein LF1_01870 [Rubripirellula obstinata]